MKGIELSEAYYNAHGAPMIANHFASYADRIAVGFVGPGSECFGFDDQISRDHDWGPGFCMWLTSEDFREIGPALQEAYHNLPKIFRGFGPRIVSPGEQARAGVIEINAFYETYLGLDHVPETLMEWLHIPEQALATCTNGKIFSDPLGKFSHWRKNLLDFFPEDVRLKKWHPDASRPLRRVSIILSVPLRETIILPQNIQRLLFVGILSRLFFS